MFFPVSFHHLPLENMLLSQERLLFLTFSETLSRNISEEWRGKIEGITYTLGGRFESSCIDCKMTIKTNNKLERRKSSNVIGVLRGEIEPDRSVPLWKQRCMSL